MTPSVRLLAFDDDHTWSTAGDSAEANNSDGLGDDSIADMSLQPDSAADGSFMLHSPFDPNESLPNTSFSVIDMPVDSLDGAACDGEHELVGGGAEERASGGPKINGGARDGVQCGSLSPPAASCTPKHVGGTSRMTPSPVQFNGNSAAGSPLTSPFRSDVAPRGTFGTLADYADLGVSTSPLPKLNLPQPPVCPGFFQAGLHHSLPHLFVTHISCCACSWLG
jgi:hypothetical protein